MEGINIAYLLIGGNVGNSRFYLEQAITLLQKRCGKVVTSSSIYETAPWGNTQQAVFLNQALALQTGLTAPVLMHHLLRIEEDMGRKRQEKYGPRIIDIDILLYNEEIHTTPDLIIPHKEMQNRRFVLAPLAEIAPTITHPLLKKTIQQLLIECPDQLPVRKTINND